VTDIKQWLEAQGLAQYAEVFVENDIDLDVLSELSEDDLEKLGLSLGHRRKLLRALDAKRRAEAPAQQAPSVPTAPAQAAEAERRQITVLFCDLVGSTELANALDPEDASALLRRYQDACAGIVVRFQGFVAKFDAGCDSDARLARATVRALAGSVSVARWREQEGNDPFTAHRCRGRKAAGLYAVRAPRGSEPGARCHRASVPGARRRCAARILLEAIARIRV